MPCVKVQAVLHTTGEGPIDVGFEIFRIADNGVADMRGVDAQLMRASGIGFHFKPGQVLTGLLDDPVKGDGMRVNKAG